MVLHEDHLYWILELSKAEESDCVVLLEMIHFNAILMQFLFIIFIFLKFLFIYLFYLSKWFFCATLMQFFHMFITLCMILEWLIKTDILRNVAELIVRKKDVAENRNVSKTLFYIEMIYLLHLLLILLHLLLTRWASSSRNSTGRSKFIQIKIKNKLFFGPSSTTLILCKY